jgi:hypothetical protein
MSFKLINPEKLRRNAMHKPQEAQAKSNENTPSASSHPTHLPANVAKAIEDVLWYLWEEARDAFIADEPGPDEDHIFRSLATVDGWFYGHDATAEDLVAAFSSDDDRATARLRVRSLRG